MSSSDDASSRLSRALEQILSGEATAEPTADWSVDDDEVVADTAATAETADTADADVAEPFELPTIVAATAVVPPVTDTAPQPEPQPTPTLQARSPTAPAHPSQVAPTVAPTPATPAPATRPATGWGDHMTSLPTNAQGAGLRAPGRRPRVRRVTRVLRHIDPWSTFKVGLLFSVVAYVVGLTAGVLLWRVADSTGTLDNVERWFTQFGWETFELKGGEVFHNAWIIGLFGAVALTGGLVLLATLFNLVSDIVGGIRMTVLEEEVVERTVSSTRRYQVRRPPVGAAGTPAAAKWDVDGDDPASAAGVGGAATPVPSVAPDWSVDDDPTVEQPASG